MNFPLPGFTTGFEISKNVQRRPPLQTVQKGSIVGKLRPEWGHHAKFVSMHPSVNWCPLYVPIDPHGTPTIVVIGKQGKQRGRGRYTTG